MASDTSKNFLFISRWYPSETNRMLGLFVRNHALAVTNFGYRVTVAYATKCIDQQKRVFRKEIISEGNLTEVIIYYKQIRILSPVIHLIAWILAINKAIKLNGKPSLIHAHILTRIGLLAYLYSRAYRVPYCVTEHWSRYYPENFSYTGFFRKKLTEFILRHAGAISVVSTRLRDAMIQCGLSFKYYIIGNSVDTGTFNIGESRHDKFRFINISCFEEKSKNLKLLICAAEELRKEGYDFDLVLVGDGEDRKMIEQYAETRIEVIFRGSLNPVGVAEELKRSHCHVLTSNYETFGIVVFEAMATGIPVITTDVADMDVLIADEYGIVIQPGDIEALKDAMRHIYNNHASYDPVKLRAKITDVFDIVPIGADIANMYTEVLRKFSKN
jgi:glycosyltransferase involved in cell wall biosynthesis